VAARAGRRIAISDGIVSEPIGSGLA
jgi:hypothetical protein